MVFPHTPFSPRGEELRPIDSPPQPDYSRRNKSGKAAKGYEPENFDYAHRHSPHRSRHIPYGDLDPAGDPHHKHLGVYIGIYILLYATLFGAKWGIVSLFRREKAGAAEADAQEE